MTLTQELVDWAWSVRAADVDAQVREAVARHVLDGLGATVGALRTGAAPYAVEVARGLGGPSVSALLGTYEWVGPGSAALATGTNMHALDFDDTHAGALIHVTATVLPIVLAVGEEVGAADDDVVEALVAGFEVVLRIGAAAPHGFHARGFHASSVCGVFGSALAACRLRGVARATAVDALGIAGSQAAGSLEFLATGSSTKQLHLGWAGLSGVVASDLASAGADGPSSILEGDAGLFRSYTGRSVDPSMVLDGLGHRFELEQVTIKPEPVCQLSHAALDAVRELDRRPAPSEISSIEVELPIDSVDIVGEPVVDKARPRTAYEAKFSLPWCLAVLLHGEQLTVDTFNEAVLAREDLQALACKVTILPVDPGVVAAAAPSRVRVLTHDGDVHEASVPGSRGTPERPLDDGSLEAKFLANVGGDHRSVAPVVKRVRALATPGATPPATSIYETVADLARRPFEEER